jgi:hypothetical protein
MPSTQPFYSQIYYSKHKTRIQNYARNYRKNNNSYFKLYYLNNRDKLLDYGKNYYNLHTEKCRSLNIAWKQKNIPGYRKTKQPITFQKINEPTIVSFN